ncbi:MAG: hypothetical protein ACU83P_06940 [Gammaproteobacteria bacterium]
MELKPRPCAHVGHPGGMTTAAYNGIGQNGAIDDENFAFIHKVSSIWEPGTMITLLFYKMTSDLP